MTPPARDHHLIRLLLLLPAALGSAAMLGPASLITQTLAVMLVADGVRVALRARG